MVGERAGRPDVGDELGLRQVWDAYASRAVWQQVLERGGDRAVAQRALGQLPVVLALEALEANREMVELLTNRRWYVMREAREAGASWPQIGAALGMSKQGAQDWYRRRIELQEQHVGDLHDADRARAALAEPTPGTSARAGGELGGDRAVGVVTYEVAESILGDLISHASAQLWDATHGVSPDPEDVARWETALRCYVAERRALGLDDPGKLREVIEVRGAELRDLTGRRPGGTSD